MLHDLKVVLNSARMNQIEKYTWVLGTGTFSGWEEDVALTRKSNSKLLQFNHDQKTTK